MSRFHCVPLSRIVCAPCCAQSFPLLGVPPVCQGRLSQDSRACKVDHLTVSSRANIAYVKVLACGNVSHVKVPSCAEVAQVNVPSCPYVALRMVPHVPMLPTAWCLLRHVAHINMSLCAYVAHRVPREVIARFPHVPMLANTCGHHVHIACTHIAHRLCPSCAKLPMCPECAHRVPMSMCPSCAKVSLAKVSLVSKSCHVKVPLQTKLSMSVYPLCSKFILSRGIAWLRCPLRGALGGYHMVTPCATFPISWSHRGPTLPIARCHHVPMFPMSRCHRLPMFPMSRCHRMPL